MKRLTRLCNKYGSDKGTAGEDSHGFSEFYEPFFTGLESPKILEIGVREGAFEKAISDFYDGDCLIYCVDIVDCESFFDGWNNIKFFKCDCGNEEDVQNLIHEFDSIKFDIVIDDASHYWAHQFLSILYFRRTVKDGGLFIVEDLHSSYDDSYRGDIIVNESPLVYIAGLYPSQFFTPEENKEISESISEVFLYSKYNPDGLYGEEQFKRSVTAVLKIDRHGV